MPSHVKTIAGTKEIVFDNGTAAMLVIFTDGDYTWWVVDGERAITNVKMQAGETIIVASEDPPELEDVLGTIH